MLLTVALLAAFQEGPRLGDPIGNVPEWIRASDQPRDAVGAVRFKVLFAIDGKPDRCDIVATTGEPKVEAAACNAIRKRFRYKPSFSSTGQPIYRVLERTAAFGVKAANLYMPTMYDLGGGGNALRLMAEVDEAGRLVSCGPWSEDSGENTATACKRMNELWKPLPEINSGGQPVRYVREIIVKQ